MKTNNYREQVALVISWFKEWSECEQTVALYSLLKKSSPIQAKFLDQVLQQSLAECTEVKQWEAKANDEGYVRSLRTEEKEIAIQQLLQLLPLLQAGRTNVKAAYLQVIPELLRHTIQNGVNIEESRRLLSYSLIHPAITTEERGTFQTWLGCLDERFTHNLNANNGGGGGTLSSSSSSTNNSSTSGGSSITNNTSLGVGLNTANSLSPSLASSSQLSLATSSLTHLSPDLSVSQEYINAVSPSQQAAVLQQQQQQQQQKQQQQQQQQPMLNHGHSPTSPMMGPAHPSWQHQGHQSPQHQGHFTSSLDASAAINPPPTLSSGETSGHQYISTSNGHMALRATNSHAGAFGASHGHMPLHATLSAPSNGVNVNCLPPPPPRPIVPGPGSQQQQHQQQHHQMPPPPPPQQQQQQQQQQQPIKSSGGHAPLRRTQSIAPGTSMRPPNADNNLVIDWLKTNHNHAPGHLPGHLPLATSQSLGSVSSVGHALLSSRGYPDHPPLSPQSSVTSSGSGGSEHQRHHGDDGPHNRDSFLEEASGMREVPVWLKTLRLHKYSYLFRQMTYEDMLSITEAYLEQQNVTKGARHKIYVSICKLRERQEVLRGLEKNIVDEGGSINAGLGRMKEMLNTPIKAFNTSQIMLTSNNPAFRTVSSTSTDSSSSSSSTTTSATTTITTTTPAPPTITTPQSLCADEVIEGDLPAQFCRLMGKVCTQLLVASRPDDECFKIYLQLIDKCLNHEAFSDRQKKLLQSWKQSAQKIWQPSPQRYGDRSRRSFGNTFHVGGSLGGRIIPRSTRGPVPPSMCHQPLSAQWSFGSKRSILGGGSSGGHIAVTRNSSLNTAYINKPGLLEVQKQTVSRTHSAPTNRPMSLPMQGCENAADTEINARLDSLCLSMTEHALGSSETNDQEENSDQNF